MGIIQSISGILTNIISGLRLLPSTHQGVLVQLIA
jgi:hypothetical protein